MEATLTMMPPFPPSSVRICVMAISVQRITPRLEQNEGSAYCHQDYIEVCHAVSCNLLQGGTVECSMVQCGWVVKVSESVWCDAVHCGPASGCDVMSCGVVWFAKFSGVAL